MLLDALPTPAVVLDGAGRIELVNERWVRFALDNGGRTDDVLPPSDYLAACDADTREGLSSVLAGDVDHFETEYPCHGPATERWFRMVVTPLAGGALVVHLDITGEYARVSRWLKTTPSVIIELAPDGDAVFVNQAWARYMGVPKRSLLGPNWADHIPGSERERLLEAVQAGIAAGTHRTVDVALPAEDGDMSWLRFLIDPYFDDYGRLRRVSLVGMDVTAPRRLHEQLAATAERERIAADIHDVVIQDLVGAGLALATARRQGTLDPELLEDVTNSLDRSVEDLRTLAAKLPSHRLQPDDVDLVIRQAARALGFTPEVTRDGNLAAADAPTAAHLVAVLNEALSNVARHAHATACAVQIAVDGRDLLLLVCDNGVGMPSEPGRRSGISNIARRAAELGGTAQWSPSPEGGTLLEWRVPAEPAPDAVTRK